MTQAQPKPNEISQARPVNIVNSQELFQGKREIIIQHLNEQYRLLITKAGKLILNK